jgi:predicted Zn finger-like uncharacterized protein
MIVSCPSCHARYKVQAETVPDQGAELECARCEASFLVLPEGQTTVINRASSDLSSTEEDEDEDEDDFPTDEGPNLRTHFQEDEDDLPTDDEIRINMDDTEDYETVIEPSVVLESLKEDNKENRNERQVKMAPSPHQPNSINDENDDDDDTDINKIVTPKKMSLEVVTPINDSEEWDDDNSDEEWDDEESNDSPTDVQTHPPLPSDYKVPSSSLESTIEEENEFDENSDEEIIHASPPQNTTNLHKGGYDQPLQRKTATERATFNTVILVLLVAGLSLGLAYIIQSYLSDNSTPPTSSSMVPAQPKLQKPQKEAVKPPEVDIQSADDAQPSQAAE